MTTKFRVLTAAGTLGTSLVWISTAVGQVAPAPVPAPAPAVQPAVATPVDELQTLVDGKKYTDAMKLATKLLSLHGQAGAGISRFRVLMLRGDAMAGTKAVSSAVNTYKAALKETTDPRELALAKWTIELFTKSKGTTFSPKVAGGGAPVATLDLNDHAERKQAFGDMLTDQLAVLGPKIHLATVSMQLGDIVPVLTQIEGLAELDVVANDNNNLTAHVSGEMLDHARNLLSSTLKGMWTRIGDIDTAANTPSTTTNQIMVNGQVVNQQRSSKPGLTTANRNELHDMIATAKRIGDVTAQFIPLAQSDKDWLQIKNDADRVVGRAGDLLAADFSGNNTGTDGNTFNGEQNSGGVTTILNGNGSNGIGFGGSNGSFPGGVVQQPGRGLPTSGGGVTTPNQPTTPTTPTTPVTPVTPIAPTTPTTPTTPTAPVKPTPPTNPHHGPVLPTR